MEELINSKRTVAATIGVWILVMVITFSFLSSVTSSRSSPNLPSTGENEVRIGLFADPQITNKKEGVESDLPGTSYEVARYTKSAINSINPDYIFGLGDLTSHSTKEGWIGYKNWLKGLEAPIYDCLGNHDRNHYYEGNNGTGYFSILGRASDSRVFKMGNNVFILVSEEHDTELDGDLLASTIPAKRFEFMEKNIEKYAENGNNIFILSHVPLTGTVAYSDTWVYGNNPTWRHITEKFMKLLYDYENSIVARITGHIHTDYRWKDEAQDRDGIEGVENIGKFVNGTKINKAERKYPPFNLPNIYFLNMPVVDVPHSYVQNIFDFLFPEPNKKSEESMIKLPLYIRKAYVNLLDKGLPIFDLFHGPITSDFLGRGAVYYFEMKEGEKNVEIVTRWIGGNRDVEKYKLELENPVQLDDRKMHFVASDLSLMSKENLTITLDNWFKVGAGEEGEGVFIKRFPKKEKIKGFSIKASGLQSYSAEWKGSNESDWPKTWVSNPEKLSMVEKVKVKIKFRSSSQEDAYIKDIDLELRNSD